MLLTLEWWPRILSFLHDVSLEAKDVTLEATACGHSVLLSEPQAEQALFCQSRATQRQAARRGQLGSTRVTAGRKSHQNPPPSKLIQT